MNIKIIGTGNPLTTNIIDMDTGEELTDVTDVFLHISASGAYDAAITRVCHRVEFDGLVDVNYIDSVVGRNNGIIDCDQNIDELKKIGGI